jgi:DNA-binding transcriptional LysR family regulator
LIASDHLVPGQALKVLPIALPSTPRPLAIVTLNRTLSPVAQTFIDGARKAARAIAVTRSI